MCEELGTDATAGGALTWDQLPDVVLREIFKRLPTSNLISSCSLVNKHWNVQARSFIRDHRECTVKIGYDNDDFHSTYLWPSFLQLNQVLGGMRIIPFNSLYIVITDENLECDEEADVNALTNLMTKFPLKFLSVYEEGWKFHSGPAASTVLNLLRQNSSNLQELEICGDMKHDRGIFKDWQSPGKFEKLKKLSITKFSSVSHECMKKIIASAPKLTAVYNDCFPVISKNMIPHTMYDTLKQLTFDSNDLDLVEKFADRLNHLEYLSMEQLSRWLSPSFPRHDANKRRFVRLCHKILRLNARSLRTLHIITYQDDSLWSQLHFPTLPSIQNLSLSVEHIDNSLIHINFPVSFPNLRQVRIWKTGSIHDLEDNNVDMLVDEDIIVAPNASQTTLELFFMPDATNCTPDLLKLRTIFPNVLKFAIDVGNEDTQPSGCIANLWPNLKGLIMGVWSFEFGELDAQVLGLHPEELELLRYEDAEFLNHVQVPPSRPCVGTLKELEHFEVDNRKGHDRETERAFLELVKTLSISRRPGLNFKMKTFPGSSRHWITHRFGEIFQTYFEY